MSSGIVTAVNTRPGGAPTVGGAALQVLAWFAVVAMLLSAVLVAALAAWTSDALGAGPLSRAVIDIDGTRFNLAELQGEQWLLAAVAAFVALFVIALVVVVVVPVIVLVSLALAALACAAALLMVVVVGALMLSPVILLVWGVRRLSRPRKPLATMAT